VLCKTDNKQHWYFSTTGWITHNFYYYGAMTFLKHIENPSLLIPYQTYIQYFLILVLFIFCTCCIVRCVVCFVVSCLVCIVVVVLCVLLLVVLCVLL